MILQLDIGNTAVKWRACVGDSIIERGQLPRAADIALPELQQSPQVVWVSSVAGAEYEAGLQALVEAQWQLSPWFARSSTMACGIRNSYQQPERMGVDRWLAMIAAWKRIGDAVCVVDAGSALTIDFLGSDGQHRGGYIIPGIAMMERALFQDTDRVRFDPIGEDSLEPGCSTEEAVFNGLQLSQAGAVSLALDRFGHGEVLLFSGGNGRRIQGLLGLDAQFVEDLVLDGLACLAAEELAAGEAG